MRRALPILIATILLALPAGFAQNAPEVDALGDPLPEGAFARLGTERLRHPGGFGAARSR
jgi:hypothetical protein